MSAPRRAAGTRWAGATALIGACAALLLVLAGSVAPSLAYVEAHSAASVNVLVGAAADEEEPDEQDAGASDEPTSGGGDATDDEAGADAGEEGGTDGGEAGSGGSGTDAGSDGDAASGGTEDAAATVFVDTGDATPTAALAVAVAALFAVVLARLAWTRRSSS